MRRVALVTHDMSHVGGLPTMIDFLSRTLIESGKYQIEHFALATSADDNASVRILSPRSWFSGTKLLTVQRRDVQFIHVGAFCAELEFQRYRPRRALSELLKPFDLIQFVVGSPPWVCAAADAVQPIVLWTATTTRADRESQLKSQTIGRRAWSHVMMSVTERFERRALERADAVLALSAYTQRSLLALGSKPPALATCGVDTQLFRPGTLGSAPGYILCVARFSDPRKNVRLLLEAYRILVSRFGDPPELVLVGDHPTEADTQFIEELGLSQRVKPLGPKQGQDVAQLYRDASLFVLSSDEEGLAIVILEAMASGLAVISTDCGGPASAIIPGETGILTPVGDPVALAAAMEEVLRNHTLRASMGRTGRSVAEESFSLAAAGRVFLNAYDALLT